MQQRLNFKVLNGWQIYIDEDGMFCVEKRAGEIIRRQSFIGICNVIKHLDKSGQLPIRAIAVPKNPGWPWSGPAEVHLLRQGTKYTSLWHVGFKRYFLMECHVYEYDADKMLALINMHNMNIREQQECETSKTKIDQFYKDKRAALIAELKPL